MKERVKFDLKRKIGINKLLRLLWELDALKSQTTDEEALRDFEIYIRDIRHFLGKSSLTPPSLEDIQVYIDDYQRVVKRMKAV